VGNALGSGDLVGGSVGTGVGCLVGLPVGLLVGGLVGLFDGLLVGILVGKNVGGGVGSLVGVMLGTSLGEALRSLSDVSSLSIAILRPPTIVTGSSLESSLPVGVKIGGRMFVSMTPPGSLLVGLGKTDAGI